MYISSSPSRNRMVAEIYQRMYDDFVDWDRDTIHVSWNSAGEVTVDDSQGTDQEGS